MANAAEAPSEPIVAPAFGEHGVVADQPAEDECTCGHSHEELPDEAKVILEARQAVASDPAAFAHEQKRFLGFEVDAGMHTLIENLWLMGLVTEFSCQGHEVLCHPLLHSSDYYAQIMFHRIADATAFFELISKVFGAGTMFGPEGFQLTATDGSYEDPTEDSTESDFDFFQRVNAAARAEVIFHPGYIEHLVDVTDRITSAPELDAKRSLLDVAEDLDEAYEILGVGEETRTLAERGCDCGEEH